MKKYCELCPNKSFKRKWQLERHIELCHQNNKKANMYYCKKCDFGTNKHKTYKNHQAKYHDTPNNNTTSIPATASTTSLCIPPLRQESRTPPVTTQAKPPTAESSPPHTFRETFRETSRQKLLTKQWTSSKASRPAPLLPTPRRCSTKPTSITFNQALPIQPYQGNSSQPIRLEYSVTLDLVTEFDPITGRVTIKMENSSLMER